MTTKANAEPKTETRTALKTETKPKDVKTPVPTSGGSYTVKDGELIKH